MNILLDAGPCLNFLAVGRQNILIRTAESQKLQLAAPARVDTEILGMCESERFKNTGVRGDLDDAEKLPAGGDPS